jgi:hypothetical protein
MNAAEQVAEAIATHGRPLWAAHIPYQIRQQVPAARSVNAWLTAHRTPDSVTRRKINTITSWTGVQATSLKKRPYRCYAKSLDSPYRLFASSLVTGLIYSARSSVAYGKCVTQKQTGRQPNNCVTPPR